MFDPHAFLSLFQIAGHLSLYVAVNLTCGRERFAEETQQVSTAGCGHGVMYQ
jgi:hypothetical protein